MLCITYQRGFGEIKINEIEYFMRDDDSGGAAVYRCICVNNGLLCRLVVMEVRFNGIYVNGYHY